MSLHKGEFLKMTSVLNCYKKYFKLDFIQSLVLETRFSKLLP